MKGGYRGCKIAINKFFKEPSKETYKKYKQALEKLFSVNPTMAWALAKKFRKQMFDKAMKEKDFE